MGRKRNIYTHAHARREKKGKRILIVFMESSPLADVVKKMHEGNEQAMEIGRNVMQYFKPMEPHDWDDAMIHAIARSATVFSLMVDMGICGQSVVSLYEREIGALVYSEENTRTFLDLIILEATLKELREDEILQGCAKRASEIITCSDDVIKMAKHIGNILVGFSDIYPIAEEKDCDAWTIRISSQSSLLMGLVLSDPSAIAFLKKDEEKKKKKNQISKERSTEDERIDLMRLVLAEKSVDQFNAWIQTFHGDHTS